MVVTNLLMPEVGIHHRLDSCGIKNRDLFVYLDFVYTAHPTAAATTIRRHPAKTLVKLVVVEAAVESESSECIRDEPGFHSIDKRSRAAVPKERITN